MNIEDRQIMGQIEKDIAEIKTALLGSALGKNQRDRTLSKTGKNLVWILDKIEKNHCLNSINDEIN